MRRPGCPCELGGRVAAPRRPRAAPGGRGTPALAASRSQEAGHHQHGPGSRETGAIEQQLQSIAAEGVGEACFREAGRRAHDLEVEFTDVEHVESICSRRQLPPAEVEQLPPGASMSA